MLKQLKVITLCFLVFLNIFTFSSFSENKDFSLFIDGQKVDFKENEKPYTVQIVDIYHGDRVSYRTMVPLRTTFEGLGATVTWNGNDQTIDVSLNGVTEKFKVNNKTEDMYYGRSNSDVTLKNNKTYVDIVQLQLVGNYYLKTSEDNKEVYLYDKNFSLVIDGQKVNFNASAGYLADEINENGYNIKEPRKVMVSVRNIFEHLGGTVTWDNKDKNAVVNIEDKEIKINIYSYKIFIDGVEYPSKGDRAKFGRGTTFIDLGFVEDILDYELEWVQQDKNVYLNKK